MAKLKLTKSQSRILEDLGYTPNVSHIVLYRDECDSDETWEQYCAMGGVTSCCDKLTLAVVGGIADDE